MQKLLVSFSLVILASCSNNAENEFEVSGTVKNASAKTIYLEEVSLINMQPSIVDSATIGNNGSFELETIAKEETLFSLRLEGDRFPVASLINDENKITVTIDVNNEKDVYSVKGSAATKSLKDYMNSSSEKMRNIWNLNQEINSLRNSKTTDSIINIKAIEKESLVKDFKKQTAEVITTAKSPSLGLFILGSYQSAASNPAFGIQGFNQQEVTKYITDLSNKNPQHSALKTLKNSMAQATLPPSNNKGLMNKPAPDFTLPDVNGVPVSLSSYKGKYVLVDFWASWCPPCRIENPNIVAAYKQFKNENFEILGVSLDRPGQKEEWLKAIKEDNLSWKQVSDLKFWDSEVVPMYNIQAIPYSVLLDPNGIVIAENLKGQELINKLNEVLK